MSKQKFEPKQGVVYHASLLSNVEMSTPGVSYTHDWNKVTAEDHLKQRNKTLAEAENINNEAADKAASGDAL